MRKLDCVCIRLLLLVSSVPALAPAMASAQRAESPYYGATQTFGVLAAYSPDSSHILLGNAERRKLLEFGASYNRRLLVNHIVNWQYSGELLPIALEGDPETGWVNHQTSPVTQTYSGSFPYPMVTCAPVVETYSTTDPETGIVYSGTQIAYCSGRRWSIGEAMSPIGFQWNFRPLRRMQPFLTAHGGYMFSTQQIPVLGAGSFNFTFDFGAGFEIFHSRTRSVRAEYRFHHISNHNTADMNPGIDNGLVQISYTFGRR